MSASSLPASLVFLSDLPDLPDRTKVRFLGCVYRYDQQSGTLWLTHNYPTSSSQLIVRVNIDLVLETVKRIDLQIGAWINVMGLTCENSTHSRARLDKSSSKRLQEVSVQATMIWNTGSMKVEEYEASLQARKDCGTAGFG